MGSTSPALLPLGAWTDLKSTFDETGIMLQEIQRDEQHRYGEEDPVDPRFPEARRPGRKEEQQGKDHLEPDEPGQGLSRKFAHNEVSRWFRCVVRKPNPSRTLSADRAAPGISATGPLLLKSGSSGGSTGRPTSHQSGW